MLRELISSIFGTNKEPTIVVKEEKKLASGSYGSYFKITDKVGVKVLRDYPAASLKELDLENCRANDEFNIQNRANQLLGRMIPEVYALVPVQMDTYFYVGILMEHVEGITMADAMKGRPNQEIADRMNAIWVRMDRQGVYKSDHHEWNVLIDNSGEERVIDWGLGATFDERKIQELQANKVA